MFLKPHPIALLLALNIFIIISCRSQTNDHSKKLVGGACEGCEAIFEYGNKTLISIDTLPYFTLNEHKLKITGTVYEKDGKTPAPNVVLYIYHTNSKGVYETTGKEAGWAKRHGIYRGWAKTGNNGKYTFYTFKPKAYPDKSEPAHIHLTVKEPDKNEYYLDDYVFDDDPILTGDKRKKLSNRGGSGIMTSTLNNSIATIERNIILGFNIPDYE